MGVTAENLAERMGISAGGQRGDHELGLVTLCIGGGQGIALLIGRA